MSADFSRQLNDSGMGQGRSIWQKLHIDVPLLCLLLLLCASGLLILYSASGQNIDMVYRQMTHFAIGFSLMIIIAQFNPHWFEVAAPGLFIAGVVALILVLLVGVGAKGAQRWLSMFGLFRFQPSEIMKLVVPMMLAWFMASRVLPPNFKVISQALLLIFIPTLLVMKQPDLGTSLLIAISGLLVLLFAGLSWRWMVLALAIL